MRRGRTFLRCFHKFAHVLQAPLVFSSCFLYERRIRKMCIVVFTVMTIIACILHIVTISGVIVCLNWKTKFAVRKLCHNYDSGLISGNLCEDLCHGGRVATVSCYVPHLAKDIVFTAKWEDRAVVIKARHGEMSAFDPYPYSAIIQSNTQLTVDDFWQIVKDIILVNYDLDFKKYYFVQPHNFLQTLLTSDFESATNAQPRKLNRSILQSIWLLVQQKEYLTFKLFENSGLFPRIYGSCGHFYAMERLTPLSDLLFADWKLRTELVIKILRLLEDAEYYFPHTLRICDMKMSHFGVDERQQLKILDGDDVYFQNVLNNIVCYSNQCRSDHDCTFFDCKMKCNFSTHTCNTKTVNSNLQAVCEKMLTESSFFKRLFKPNLIHSLPTPLMAALAPVLKMCVATTETSDNKGSFFKMKEKILKTLTLKNFLNSE